MGIPSSHGFHFDLLHLHLLLLNLLLLATLSCFLRRQKNNPAKNNRDNEIAEIHKQIVSTLTGFVHVLFIECLFLGFLGGTLDF